MRQHIFFFSTFSGLPTDDGTTASILLVVVKVLRGSRLGEVRGNRCDIHRNRWVPFRRILYSSTFTGPGATDLNGEGAV